MLSRHAENLYWLGRHIERAEDTARMLDVTYHNLLESPPADESTAWRELLEVLYLDAVYDGRLDGPGGLRVRGIATGARSAGQAATAVVRPESVRLLEPAEAEAGEASGQVDSVVFVGGFARIFVRLADGTLIQAKRLTHAAQRVPGIGDTVRLGWPAAATVLLEDART